MEFFFSFYMIFPNFFFQFLAQIFEKLTPSEVPITKIYECINFLISLFLAGRLFDVFSGYDLSFCH